MTTFRLGKKQKRAILTESGHEVVVFAKGKEDMAALVCELLNKHYRETAVSYHQSKTNSTEGK